MFENGVSSFVPGTTLRGFCSLEVGVLVGWRASGRRCTLFFFFLRGFCFLEVGVFVGWRAGRRCTLFCAPPSTSTAPCIVGSELMRWLSQ
jgi:hypothetical protein